MTNVTNIDSIGRYLYRVRIDSKETNNEIKVADVSKVLGLSQTYINRAERGEIDNTIIKKWQPAQQLSLLKTYNLSNSKILEVSKKYGLQAHLLLESTSDNSDKYFMPTPEFIDVPLVATGSAGMGDSEEIEGYVKLEKKAAKGHEEENIKSLLVNGNCLVSHEVRFNVRNIAHGDLVYMDKEQAPKNHDIVVYWDNRIEQLIIKLYKEQDSNIILYDARGVMVPKPQFESDLKFKGVVFWRSGGTSV